MLALARLGRPAIGPSHRLNRWAVRPAPLATAPTSGCLTSAFARRLASVRTPRASAPSAAARRSRLRALLRHPRALGRAAGAADRLRVGLLGGRRLARIARLDRRLALREPGCPAAGAARSRSSASSRALVDQDLRFVNVFQEHALAARELQTQADALARHRCRRGRSLDLRGQSELALARAVTPFFLGAGGHRARRGRHGPYDRALRAAQPPGG